MARSKGKELDYSDRAICTDVARLRERVGGRQVPWACRLQGREWSWNSEGADAMGGTTPQRCGPA